MSQTQFATARFARCAGDAAWLLSHPSTLLPFALLSGIELVLLLDYSLFANPLGSGTVVAVMAAVFGDHVWHYPDHILELPRALMAFETMALIGLGFLAIPWGIAYAARRLRERRDLRPKADPWFGPRLPVLFAINTLFVALAIVLRIAAVAIFDVGPLRRLAFAAEPSGLFAFSFVMLSGVYSLAYIALVDDGMVDALRHGFRITRRYAGINITIAAAVTLISLPGAIVLGLVPGFVEALSPELAVFVAVFAVMWHTLARFFLVGLAVAMTLDVKGDQ